MTSDPSVAESGEVHQTPVEGDLYVSEVDMGYGEIGCYIEWQNISDCWILAKDTESFVSLDENI